jgi:hypothetical protein
MRQRPPSLLPLLDGAAAAPDVRGQHRQVRKRGAGLGCPDAIVRIVGSRRELGLPKASQISELAQLAQEPRRIVPRCPVTRRLPHFHRTLLHRGIPPQESVRQVGPFGPRRSRLPRGPPPYPQPEIHSEATAFPRPATGNATIFRRTDFPPESLTAIMWRNVRQVPGKARTAAQGRRQHDTERCCSTSPAYHHKVGYTRIAYPP